MTKRLPGLISNVANPFVIFTALYAATTFSYAGPVGRAALYLGLELLAAASVAGYVLRLRRRREVGDFWISTRRERLVPALVLLASFVALLAALAFTKAPPELFRATLSMGLAAATVAALTTFWKASAHSAVAGHAAVAGTILLGVFGLPFVGLLPLVGWARVAQKAHTLAQVLVGVGVGSLLAGLFLL
ncbi:hypothetical protein [Rubrobacter indicoceani]|uniref:hypothetical protein n=1 Tax=Rubrobacter indicoceani TaxID=2051957 RepID=UPI0013C50068|nr:hypothetical protein [Rubrobacter indicoceani]